MNSFTVAVIILLGVLFIDYAVRFAVKRSRDRERFNSAGIITLVLLSINKRHARVFDKAAIIKQLLLSMLVVLFLLVANHFLLTNGVPKEANILQFGLILAPLFIVPFYHFLYELLLVQPLSIDGVLADFHLRGVLSLILSANLIFISLEPMQSIVASIGHLVLVVFSLCCSFYVCTGHRKKPSTFDFIGQDRKDYLEPATFRYLAAILEFLYCLVLLYLFFLQGLLESLAWPRTGSLTMGLALLGSLLFITIIVKFRFYQDKAVAIEFYEDRILPLSFLLFGIATVFRLYLGGIK
ncbi:MAG TPA: hypothetical protein VEL47_06545 [Myxococcota bacterium]|nr:hypothetical protein [Myxococcota bacterium]